MHIWLCLLIHKLIFCHALVMELAAVLYYCTYNKISVLCGSKVESAEIFAVCLKHIALVT